MERLVQDYAERGALEEFIDAGGIQGFNKQFEKLSELRGEEVIPSESAIANMIVMYYEHGDHQVGDSLKQAYYNTYKPDEDAINDLGYQILEVNSDKALEIFKDNVERHPNSANVWDSLGDGYWAQKTIKKPPNTTQKPWYWPRQAMTPEKHYFAGTYKK